MSAVSKIVAATALTVSMAAANAGLVVDFFDGTNLFAKMTTSNTTDFDLSFVGDGVAAGGFIGDLYMAGPSGTFSNLSGTGSPGTASYSASGFTNAGQTFNWAISFPTSNGPTSNRLDIGESALFSIVVTDPNAWDFDMIHVQAYNAAGDSIKLIGCIDGQPDCGGGGGGGGGGGTVPEPASLALVGLGLLLAAIVRRRGKA